MASTTISFSSLRGFVEETIGSPRRYSPQQALLDYGCEWKTSIQRPSWLVPGPKKQCFTNARGYALSRNDVFYTEGLAMDVGLGIPMEHAWLVDGKGTVIDPTWDDPENCSYFGIAFARSFVIESIELVNDGPILHPVTMRRHYPTAVEVGRGVWSLQR